MARQKIRAAVNGYGVIGKRVADAIRVQPDMELVGISDVVSDYRVKTAVSLGISVYASLSDKQAEMEAAGIPVAGTLDDLLSKVEVIVDCTPKGIGAKNLDRYRAVGVKAIFQGGEKHSLTGHSFVAQANYASALGRSSRAIQRAPSALWWHCVMPGCSRKRAAYLSAGRRIRGKRITAVS